MTTQGATMTATPLLQTVAADFDKRIASGRTDRGTALHAPELTSRTREWRGQFPRSVPVQVRIGNLFHPITSVERYSGPQYSPSE